MQGFLTVAGTVGVIAAVLAGLAAGLLATVVTDHLLHGPAHRRRPLALARDRGHGR
jgi:hypothetical protein